MSKMQELQSKLFIALEKEQKIYETLLLQNSKDRSKLKRCQQHIMELHHQMKQIEMEKQQEIQEIVLPELWQETLLQSYLGSYKNQKNRHLITDITPRNNTTVEIHTTTAPFSPLRHKPKATSLLHSTIILMESEHGLISYNEQEHAETDTIEKVSLKIKDNKKNKYRIQLIKDAQNRTIINGQIERWRCGLHFVFKAFYNDIITSQDLSRITENILSRQFAPYVQKDYYNYLAKASSQIDLFNEISNYRKKQL